MLREPPAARHQTYDASGKHPATAGDRFRAASGGGAGVGDGETWACLGVWND